MTNPELSSLHQDYLACLNQQDWPTLGRFVDANVEHNSRPLGLTGYRQMLEDDFAAIPDLFFHLDLLVAESPFVASRLRFACTPTSRFLGLEVNGRTVVFAENVFYEFRAGKIVRVWSVIDKAAIEAQLAGPDDHSSA